MNQANSTHEFYKTQLAKCPIGIQRLDEITGGGLPKERLTLVCGSVGSSKTLLNNENA